MNMVTFWTAIAMRRNFITPKSKMMTMIAKRLVQHHRPLLVTETWLVHLMKILNTKDKLSGTLSMFILLIK